MKNIALSINPTYLCNFRCPACYLTTSQLSDVTTTPLDDISRLLLDVSTHRMISTIDLYGGEIGTLPVAYQRALYDIVRQHYAGPINVITNLLKTPHIVGLPGVQLSVSYDFQYRERHDTVLRNMRSSEREINVLVLATPEVVQGDVDDMIRVLNSVEQVATVEIKPYSSNQANQLGVTYSQFEEFIVRWMQSPEPKRFHFINEQNLRNVVTGVHNSFSDDHLYITPMGRYAVLDFDLNDREFFRELDTFGDYVEWTEREKSRSFTNSYCNTCQYLGRCLTEHLRDVKDVTNSCNGHYNLIRWYKSEKMGNSTRSVLQNRTPV